MNCLTGSVWEDNSNCKNLPTVAGDMVKIQTSNYQVLVLCQVAQCKVWWE